MHGCPVVWLLSPQAGLLLIRILTGSVGGSGLGGGSRLAPIAPRASTDALPRPGSGRGLRTGFGFGFGWGFAFAFLASSSFLVMLRITFITHTARSLPSSPSSSLFSHFNLPYRSSQASLAFNSVLWVS